MEKGNAAQFKSKNLDEIDIDMEGIEENEEITLGKLEIFC